MFWVLEAQNHSHRPGNFVVKRHQTPQDSPRPTWICDCKSESLPRRIQCWFQYRRGCQFRATCLDRSRQKCLILQVWKGLRSHWNGWIFDEFTEKGSVGSSARRSQAGEQVKRLERGFLIKYRLKATKTARKKVGFEERIESIQIIKSKKLWAERGTKTKIKGENFAYCEQGASSVASKWEQSMLQYFR